MALDQHWILRTTLSPEEINERLQILVSGKGARRLLAKRGEAPRVIMAKVAPDWIPVVRSSPGGFGIWWDVYPPRLAGNIWPREFVLRPGLGNLPSARGQLLVRGEGTDIDIRLEPIADIG